MSFAAIYRRHHQGLYRYCLAILGNPEDAQDALQNTMVKAMRALQGEKREIKLKPWLYRIAHNESIDLLRKRRPVVEIDEEASASGPSTAETVEGRERLRTLIADLEELPDRQRGALTMRELAGLSFEQIGAAFDTSPAVARQTVYEARVSLRQMSEGRDMSCDEVCRALSDADGRVLRRRDIRAHLKSCPGCREFRAGIAARRRDFAALSPLPAIASAALLRGLLSGGGSGAAAGAGGGLAGSIGAGAGKAVGASALVKASATVAVVAAVGAGAGAADRGGLVDVPLIPSAGSGEQSALPGADPASSAAKRRRAAATRRAARHGDAAAQRASGRVGAPGATPAANPGHGNTADLPAASRHGQETAASRRSARGGRSKPRSPPSRGQSQAKGQGRASPSPSAKSKPQGPRPQPSPPTKVAPDKSPAVSLKPSNSANQGAPDAAAQP